jgi:hypothetical protein
MLLLPGLVFKPSAGQVCNSCADKEACHLPRAATLLALFAVPGIALVKAPAAPPAPTPLRALVLNQSVANGSSGA